jgi:hypothetical protein
MPADRSDRGYRLRLRLAKRSAYVGEPVEAEVRLHQKRDAETMSVDFVPFVPEGFWMKRIGSPQRLTEGNESVRIMRYLLFPQRPGRLAVGPVEAKVALPKKVRDAFGFSVRGVRWLRIKSDRAVLEVREPPQHLRLVGRFQWQVRVAPEKVRAGDPVTLTVRIAGWGNLEDIKVPEPRIEGVTVYARKPRIQERYEAGRYGGVWQRRFLLIADRNFTVPAMTLRYFDPTLHAVKELRSDAVTVAVQNNGRSARPWVAMDGEKRGRDIMGWIYANLVLAFLLGMATMYFGSRLSNKWRKRAEASETDKGAKRYFARLMPHIAESQTAAQMAEKLYETIRKGEELSKSESRKIEKLLQKLRK